MNYLVLVILAVIFQSTYYLLLKNMVSDIPSEMALIYVNSIATIVAVVFLYFSETRNFALPSSTLEAGGVIAAGLFLSGGLLLFYRALELGPISVVQPIFGMATVVVAFTGALAFSEPLTARKIAGILLAGLAIFLVSG